MYPKPVVVIDCPPLTAPGGQSATILYFRNTIDCPPLTAPSEAVNNIWKVGLLLTAPLIISVKVSIYVDKRLCHQAKNIIIVKIGQKMWQSDCWERKLSEISTICKYWTTNGREIWNLHSRLLSKSHKIVPITNVSSFSTNCCAIVMKCANFRKFHLIFYVIFSTFWPGLLGILL